MPDGEQHGLHGRRGHFTRQRRNSSPATAGPVLQTRVHEVVPSAANVRYGPGLGSGVNCVLSGGDRVTVWGNAETKDADHFTWVNISYSDPVTSNLRQVDCYGIT